MRRLSVIATNLAVWLMTPTLHAQTELLTEKQKIESMIRSVELLSNAKFVRNGSEYPSSSAARFLRAKWNANSGTVRTAADFIDKVGSASGTTGEPYLIRFKDGREVKSRDFFTDELKKLK